MRNVLLALALCLAACVALPGCDTEHNGRFVIVIECSMPPELCGASDAEFDAFWATLDEAERDAFVEEYGRPESRDGFIAASPVPRKDR